MKKKYEKKILPSIFEYCIMHFLENSNMYQDIKLFLENNEALYFLEENICFVSIKQIGDATEKFQLQQHISLSTKVIPFTSSSKYKGKVLELDNNEAIQWFDSIVNSTNKQGGYRQKVDITTLYKTFLHNDKYAIQSVSLRHLGNNLQYVLTYNLSKNPSPEIMQIVNNNHFSGSKDDREYSENTIKSCLLT